MDGVEFAGLKNVLVAAASVPRGEYVALLLIIGLVWLYNAMEFHVVGDALKAWRGDVVHLIYSPKSKIAAELLPQCQTLNKRYCVTPWLASPHVQTLFLHFFGRSPRVDYQRQLYITPDGGTIALDWVHPSSVIDNGNGGDTRHSAASDETPTVVIVPGLTSDSSNHYVKHMVRGLSDKGWRVLVINHRGLGGVSITSDHFYNAGWTEDLRKLIPFVHQKYPKSPLLAIGASLGANILVKYLGEEGPKSLIGGAVAICCPWDLVVCDRFITRKWVQALYNKALATGLCQYAQLHQAVLSRMMDWSLLSGSKTVRDFDNHCTRHVGRYETVDTYYRKCGSAQFLESVAVPLLCVSAEDDPICTKEALPYDECRVNPSIILAVTKHGGHLGYFEGLGGNSVWYVRALTEFSKALLSSSLLHQPNEVQDIEPSRTNMVPGIDQGPFLALGDDCRVAAGAEDSNAILEGQAETSELRQETSVDPLLGPHLIKDKSGQLTSGHLAEDGNYVMVGDDFGGPLYKHVEDTLEGRDSLGHEKSKEDKHRSGGQTTVKLQIRSFSELMALQSVLSQLLQQVRQQSGLEEVRQGAGTSTVGLPGKAPFDPAPVNRLSRLSYAASSKEDKEGSPSKVSLHNYSKKLAAREKVGSVSSQPQNVKKDLASHIASQNRRTFWLLTYIALITTFPFLGSALMVRTRGKIVQVLSRHLGKYKT
ncbi:hypothetical protein R1flu_024093 [Riccia fluitans]|uniref:AB hydrolase-1 domain-containing protein n=1 Tax=Riccia fluitans TaxID=41844 RepID=A0ABD1XWX9_9MARC